MPGIHILCPISSVHFLIFCVLWFTSCAKHCDSCCCLFGECNHKEKEAESLKWCSKPQLNQFPSKPCCHTMALSPSSSCRAQSSSTKRGVGSSWRWGGQCPPCDASQTWTSSAHSPPASCCSAPASRSCRWGRWRWSRCRSTWSRRWRACPWCARTWCRPCWWPGGSRRSVTTDPCAWWGTACSHTAGTAWRMSGTTPSPPARSCLLRNAAHIMGGGESILAFSSPVNCTWSPQD